jgi:hypothetical protein
MNKNNQSNKITISVSVMYALLVVSSLFVIGNGILASNAAAQNMTGENATGTEFMGSTVNTTNATSSPEAAINMTRGNASTQTP